MQKNSIIKWVGSKRKQAPTIVNEFPNEINTFYEPFFGSGAVTLELLQRIKEGKINCRKIICSDLSEELIQIWNIVKNDPESILNYYTEHYNNLINYNGNTVYEPKDVTKEVIQKVQGYFYEERARFNGMDKDNAERPYLLFWLLRTCYSGLARYNKKGKFNSPFHVGGKFGIHPDKLRQVFDDIRILMNGVDILFVSGDYREVTKDAVSGDLLYFDPPYANVKGIYDGGFDNKSFFEYLDGLTDANTKWLLSYDGILGTGDDTGINKTYDVPVKYERHYYIDSFNSVFRTLRNNADNKVADSLYINY